MTTEPKLNYTQREMTNRAIDGMLADPEKYAARYVALLEVASVLDTIKTRFVLELREAPTSTFPCAALTPDIVTALAGIPSDNWIEELR